jgi:hypothetical protein
MPQAGLEFPATGQAAVGFLDDNLRRDLYQWQSVAGRVGPGRGAAAS